MMINQAKQFLILCLTCCVAACGAGVTDNQATNSASSPQITTSSSSRSATSSSTSSTTAPQAPTNNTSTSTSSGKKVSTSWKIPTTREDGSPLMLSDLRGYEIYYYKSGTPQGQGTVISINDPSATTYTTSTLSPGTYYFAISSIDTNGTYSALSDYAAVTIL